ncbi:MAG TPA: BTAD domain-containing putative transcriptional regulator [Pseudonocardiaceae bacterium]|nr:BTAD domain-containing putative transcriptional regulator [Pseudonocardiaceae bacterium]
MPEFRVLGPLEVTADGQVLDLGGPRLRALVALLTANLGQVVSVTVLVDELWGEQAPGDARRTARTYVSRLRRVLGPAAELIVTHPAGYLLRTEPDRVDAARFARLADAGRQQLAVDQPGIAIDRLSTALALWRGDAYTEFADIPALHAESTRLHRLWLATTVHRIDAELATGAGESVVGELFELTGRHPGHDRLWGQLMIALYRAGRQAEAVEAFLRARAALVEQSGLDPSPTLVGIHRQVLAHDPRLLAAKPSGVRVATVRPAQLPPDVGGFTGRDRELSELDKGQAESVAAYVVSGTAGVGKTALAVHWARRIRAKFPDGQLYVNLRGFDPAGTCVPPAAAIRGFLDAFGVPPSSIPAGLDAQTGLYRSLLTGRRVLVVLDNARDAEQVRPLLPGAPGCVALVTSRDRLTSLITVEGARPLTVDLLGPAAARELLIGRLGPDRVLAELGAVDEIAARCAGLPLALAIVAAHAAAQPGLPLATFAKDLRESGGPLDFLDGGDTATRVRTVFSWSYHALGAAAARLFRLLSLHAGPDIALPAAAALADWPPDRVRGLLAELCRGHLLAEHAPGRYGYHDLLRGYAAELAASLENSESRRAAMRRVLDHYLHTADAADAVLTPRPPAQPGPAPEFVATHQQAQSWFAAERPVLLTAVRRAADTGFDAHAWQLAATLTTFLDRHGYWRMLTAAQTIGLAAARRQGEKSGEAGAHRALGLAADRAGDLESAREHYRLALELFAAQRDHPGQARTHQHLARMSAAQDDHRQAREHARHSLEHYAAADDRAGQAAALNALGWCDAQLGRYRPALTPCGQALTLAKEIGDLSGQAHIWDSLGFIHHHLREHDRAVDCYRQAVELLQRTGERRSEATAAVCLGEAQLTAGDVAAARRSWQRALSVLDELGSPEGDSVRTRAVANLDGGAITSGPAASD